MSDKNLTSEEVIKLILKNLIGEGVLDEYNITKEQADIIVAALKSEINKSNNK